MRTQKKKNNNDGIIRKPEKRALLNGIYKTDDITHRVITYNYHFPSNYGLYDEETGIVGCFVRIGKRGVIFLMKIITETE